MARPLPPLPSSNARAVQTPSNVLDPTYYVFLSALLKVVAEQSAQIETLRVALNEARTAPTTVYPAVPAF